MPSFIEMERLHPLLARFPDQELWRLFVDGTQQNAGWRVFEEREPGYMRAMLSSFYKEMLVISEKPNQPLEVADLLRMHENVLAGVSNTLYDKNRNEDPKAFRNKSHSSKQFGLCPYSNLTRDGLAEIYRDSEPLEDSPYGLAIQVVNLHVEHVDWDTSIAPLFNVSRSRVYPVSNPPLISKYFLMLMNSDIDVDVLAKELVSSYNDDIKLIRAIKDKGTKEKALIARIIKLVTDLERSHLFSDGNCRTFCVLMLYRELIRHDLLPPILDDPNVFDGYSQDELYTHVVRGQKRTLQLMNGEDMDDFVLPKVHNLGFATNTTLFYHADVPLTVTPRVTENVRIDSSVCFRILLAESMPLISSGPKYILLLETVENRGSPDHLDYMQFMAASKCFRVLDVCMPNSSVNTIMDLVPERLSYSPSSGTIFTSQEDLEKSRQHIEYSRLLDILASGLCHRLPKDKLSQFNGIVTQNVDAVRHLARAYCKRFDTAEGLARILAHAEPNFSIFLSMIQVEVYAFAVNAIRSGSIGWVKKLMGVPKLFPEALVHACLAGAFLKDKIEKEIMMLAESNAPVLNSKEAIAASQPGADKVERLKRQKLLFLKSQFEDGLDPGSVSELIEGDAKYMEFLKMLSFDDAPKIKFRM